MFLSTDVVSQNIGLGISMDNADLVNRGWDN